MSTTSFVESLNSYATTLTQQPAPCRPKKKFQSRCAEKTHLKKNVRSIILWQQQRNLYFQVFLFSKVASVGRKSGRGTWWRPPRPKKRRKRSSSSYTAAAAWSEKCNKLVATTIDSFRLPSLAGREKPPARFDTVTERFLDHNNNHTGRLSLFLLLILTFADSHRRDIGRFVKIKRKNNCILRSFSFCWQRVVSLFPWSLASGLANYTLAVPCCTRNRESRIFMRISNC